mgnify:CR=1 FL=1
MVVHLAVALVLGVLTGLGTGGGSLLLLYLTLVLHMDSQAARAMNSLFYFPSALIACFFRLKGGDLRLKPLLPAIAAGCVCSAVFSLAGPFFPKELLKKGFGVLLLWMGAKELLYRERNAK